MKITDTFLNLRDLHGWECEKGKTIKPGFIYRSPVLRAQNQEDLNYLIGLNVDCAFDFRCPCEVREKRDTEFNDVRFFNYPVYDENDYKLLVVAKSGRLRCAFLRGEKVNRIVESKFQCYKEMPFSSAFSHVFKAMDQGRKFIFHCSEGKDRTGIMSALILYVLGASLDTIMEDYLASNKFRPEKDRQWFKKLGFPQNLIDAIKYCESTHEDLLKASYKSVLDKYGSMENYLLKCFDITEERMKKWREFYLVDIENKPENNQ